MPFKQVIRAKQAGDLTNHYKKTLEMTLQLSQFRDFRAQLGAILEGLAAVIFATLPRF